MQSSDRINTMNFISIFIALCLSMYSISALSDCICGQKPPHVNKRHKSKTITQKPSNRTANQYLFQSHVATIRSMTKEQVLKIVQNQTLISIPWTTLGKEFFPDSLAIYYGYNNKAHAKLNNKPMTNDPQIDLGIWTVDEDGKLCITWNYWYQSLPSCTYLYDAKNSIIFLDAENTFVSLVPKTNIKSGNQLDAI